MSTRNPLLSVRKLVKHYPQRDGWLRKGNPIRAVDGVSFDLHAGETLGLVGESGCGKSTVARMLMNLTEPTAGEANLRGQDLFELSRRQLKNARRDLQLVFQDPYSSLNPRMTVEEILSEPWKVHGDIVERSDWKRRTAELLDQVGLSPEHASRYPHEFSGGQQQRIGIARALAVDPAIVICDEPVSALDVSVQAQVMNLLADIQKDTGVAFLFIAHDLSVVRHISDRVAVMYLGRIVEIGDADAIYTRPSHPYTQALLSAVPTPDPDKDRRGRIILEGDVPSPADPPSGCSFRTRCWLAQDICAAKEPKLIVREGTTTTRVACHFAGTEAVASSIRGGEQG